MVPRALSGVWYGSRGKSKLLFVEVFIPSVESLVRAFQQIDYSVSLLLHSNCYSTHIIEHATTSRVGLYATTSREPAPTTYADTAQRRISFKLTGW